ncbi:MAG: 1-acyl-sn-glycerol-3-phosphate acyltransferase [Candidatus Eremiobacteraeota bacterium]|nr:1-acyl-sn-glycerol-3-phosphate acyltransferase [Candidatus Eremiobacteraeota bacterium]MBV8583476.1 1-acyl-sn-glycerol-3-phosphate acyltransferase [Candidatus Eremiobacteraeota bacterium]
MNGHALSGVIAGGARFIAGVNATWHDPKPLPKQTVFLANHTSHLDFVVLWASLPRELRARTRPVAAQDYWDHGMKKFLAVDVFNAILVPRHRDGVASAERANDTIDRIAREMGDAYSIIIFPEGTRGDGEEVARFKSGLYYLCQRKPGIQLVPVYMENLNRILPKGEFAPVPFISRVTFGSPTRYDAPGGSQSESKEVFLTRMRDAVLALRQP